MNTINNLNPQTNYFNANSPYLLKFPAVQATPQLVSNIKQNSGYKGSELSVFVGSWNVAGKEFPENFSVIQWLFPLENMQLPDLYVIGFQEICNLNAKNIMISSNTHRVDNLKSILTYNLNQLGKYALVKSLDLVGLLVLVFIKEELCEYIKNIETASLRTGLYGTLGNKGSCLIRFDFDEASFVFCCSHLKAGSSHSNANSRTSEISEILNKNFTLKNSKEIKFREHGVQFIFGDLNFRVDIDLNNCLEFIKSGYLETLLLYDQLYTKKSLNLELMELEELAIKFPPTYKYLINSNEYDLKEKRIPSWCDRILFNRSGKVKGLQYNHVEMFRESDHKPIYGLYKVKLREEDQLNAKVKVSSMESFPVGNNINSNHNIVANLSGRNFASGNNNVPNAPSNNVNNAMTSFYNNQNFYNAVQILKFNNSDTFNQQKQLNPYVNNNNFNNNFNNNDNNSNQMLQGNNMNNISSNLSNKNVLEGKLLKLSFWFKFVCNN